MVASLTQLAGSTALGSYLWGSKPDEGNGHGSGATPVSSAASASAGCVGGFGIESREWTVVNQTQPFS